MGGLRPRECFCFHKPTDKKEIFHLDDWPFSVSPLDWLLWVPRLIFLPVRYMFRRMKILPHIEVAPPEQLEEYPWTDEKGRKGLWRYYILTVRVPAGFLNSDVAECEARVVFKRKGESESYREFLAWDHGGSHDKLPLSKGTDYRLRVFMFSKNRFGVCLYSKKGDNDHHCSDLESGTFEYIRVLLKTKEWQGWDKRYEFAEIGVPSFLGSMSVSKFS